MHQSPTIARLLSLLAVLMTAACGAGPDDPDAFEDELASTDDEPVLQFSVKCDPRRMGTCNPRRATPEENSIWNKLNSLPADVKAAYYATPLDSIRPTPDGQAFYQWYEGSLGLGTIYSVNEQQPLSSNQCGTSHGTFAIYGGVLNAWANGGYERGLGYPTTERLSVTGGGQSFRCTSQSPTLATQGLVKEVVVIYDIPEGQGSVHWERSYMVGRDPSSMSSGPQPCRYVDSYTCPTNNPDPNWRWIEPLYDPSTPNGQFLWCGSGDPYAGACAGAERIKP